MNRNAAAGPTFTDISARIGAGWPAIHEQMGIGAHFLRNRPGPCPSCGGKDRFRYDNKGDRGTFYCNGCGAGDGFELLMRVNRWSHAQVRAELIRATGMDPKQSHQRAAAVMPRVTAPSIVAMPPPRVLRLVSERIPLVESADAVDYLRSRCIWPLAARSSLRAHAGVDYYDDGRVVGRYPAILAAVRDVAGELVTIHVTYLDAGRKLKPHEPRKLLSGMVGRQGCAVRLQPLQGDELAIAEGVETALSAYLLHGIVTWAATNATMMEKFTPPPAVRRLVIFADADEAGQTAAARLVERLSAQTMVEVRSPPGPFKDWNDVLTAGARS